MFNRIKKAIFRDSRVPGEASPSLLSQGPVSEWAATRGLSFSQSASGSTVSMQGKVAGRPWRLELGRPTRDYINGEELRAHAEEIVRERLAPERTALFHAMVEQARRVVRERENTRFERTRAFGVIRRLFTAMGSRLAEAGGVASGKSTVSAILAELGAVVIDADVIAREVVEPGGRRSHGRPRARPHPRRAVGGA